MSVIDALYAQACDVVRGSGTLEEWVEQTGLAKNTIQKIRTDSSGSQHNANSKLRLIDAVLRDKVGLQYSLLSDAMGMREEDHEGLKRFFGELTYVRQSVHGGLTSGKILIKERFNHVMFEHIPQYDSDLNENTEGTVVHSGLVFLFGNRLVFLGLGNRHSRMMLALHHDSPIDSILEGIVLSPDTQRNIPMAAVFFMAHETFKRYSQFESEYRRTYNDKLSKMDMATILGLLTI